MDTFGLPHMTGWQKVQQRRIDRTPRGYLLFMAILIIVGFVLVMMRQGSVPFNRGEGSMEEIREGEWLTAYDAPLAQVHERLSLNLNPPERDRPAHEDIEILLDASLAPTSSYDRIR